MTSFEMKVMELTSGNLGVPICKMDHHHWFSHSSRQPTLSSWTLHWRHTDLTTSVILTRHLCLQQLLGHPDRPRMMSSL